MQKLFNTLKIIKRINEKAALAFIVGVSLTAFGCGKRKPPLPPVERVAQRVEIKGFQRGNRVLLQWTLPPRNAAGGSLLNISRADVYRIAEPLNAPLALSEEEFAARSTLIATIPLSDADFARRASSFDDPLDFAGQAARLRYAVRLVNAAGQKAAFSNFLLIEPAARVADAPGSLAASATQAAVVLTWAAPDRNIDESTPPNILGYNVYRTDVRDGAIKQLNTAPVTKTDFADATFEFGRQYTYLVRTVSLGTGGEPLESLDSNAAAIGPVDVFAPSAPASITIAAAPGTISIFFASNPETDVAGYRLYRSEDSARPLSDWTLLTPEPLTANTYQDARVEAGKTYFYYLTAVDKFGNVSQPSVVVSETAP
jgi:hypothetical protein